MAIVNPSTPPSEAKRAIPSSRYSLPLYDPHGLGSPSNDDLNNTHDPQLQHQQDGSLLPSNAGHEPVTPLMDQSLRPSRRGRRRRSSEFAHTNLDSGSGSNSSNEGVNRSEEATGEPLLWWQRSQQASDTLQSEQLSETVKYRQPVLAPLETKSTAQSSSSPSPSVRSPAAAFLSSMNESLGSPSSQAGSVLQNERDYSISPIRSSSQNYRLSMPLMSSLHGSEGSTVGLTSAAAQLFDADNGNGLESRSASSSMRPDEEGATIGPDGRYLLGRTIGFGGFSTIREAWDLGQGAEKRVTSDREDMHRIAVKIVYSTDETGQDDAAREDEELKIWNTIPAHPNLLPLLHHERIITEQSVSGPSKTQAISFLVMPYCEGSLLAYVKSEGSLPDNTSASPSIQSLSRGGSLKSTKTPLQQYEPSLRQQSAYTRTGSGFIPRSAGMRVASVPLSNVLGQSPSASGTPSSSMLRRGSSRLSRVPRLTNGVPFSAVRKVMQQVTEALMCLHTRAGIVHGDLKLENVLGQRSVSTRPRRRSEYGREEPDSDDESMQDVLSINESICWRVADFGLARKIPLKGRARKEETHQHIADMQERATMARKGKATVGGAGGSLAYTAPETFLPNGHSVTDAEEAECSPFASDMWALGCILYALCSGKLPFSDSFEPRLQMKIAKGTWDMPLRLRRRKERKSVATATTQPSVVTRRERSTSGYVANESMSRTSSLSSSFAAYKPPHPVSAATGGSSTVMDMSASMPALQERHFFENNGMKSGSDQSIVDHGLVNASFVVEEREESSAESDDDEQIDREMDGTSRDRLSLRLMLRKLLEPDPRKRWTIEQLANHEWISEAAPTAFTVVEQESSRRLSNADDYPALQGSFLGQSLSKRPSLAHPSISEHTSQEVTPTYDGAGDGSDKDDYGRGRSIRRESAAGGTGPAKPIDIDRSTSRSHSRPRASRADSSPWEMASSFERAVQMAGPWEHPPTRRPLHRSTSADTHWVVRGTSSPSKERRSASRPPRLEAVKAEDRGRREHSPAPPTSTSTRGSDGSASRSSTSRSRSRARDTLYEIASRVEPKESSDERLWWQRGRKSAR